MKHRIMSHCRWCLTSLCWLWLVAPAAAQNYPYDGWLTPRESPPATVVQTIGLTEVTLKYHRPAVKGRAIWGQLEAWDKVWRAGANEATTISFSTPVKIEGQPLAAGTYALMMIPNPNEWTVIFNKNARQWGAFTYQAEQDALRVKVKPQTAEMQERLLYSFPGVTEDSAQLVMHWEKVRVPLTIGVDPIAQTLTRVKQGFNWQAGYFVANYFYQRKTQFEEALKWINASLALEDTVGGHVLKARLLAELKRFDEARAAAARAATLAEKAANPAQAKATVEKLLADLKNQQN